MNKKQQQIYIAFFDQILETQQALDSIKLKLIDSLGYNPNLLFNLISFKNQQITIQQMRNYMNQRMAVNQRQLYQIFQRFDWSRLGYISRNDFIKQLLPYKVKNNQVNLNNGTVTAEIQELFITYLLEILRRLRIIDVARKQVSLIRPYDAFGHIDYNRSGIIGLGELRLFFQQNDFRTSQRQLGLLLHGLRRRAYLQVNLQVFCQNLDPLQFGQYEAYKNQIQEQKQKQFMTRSRRQEQIVHRSRVQSQKVQHQLLKAQRRKQAQLERQLQLQDRINQQLVIHSQQREKIIRKVALEDEREARWNLQNANILLQQQSIKNQIQAQKNTQLSYLQQRQRQLNQNLARNALYRQKQIQNSRKCYNYQRQLRLRQQIQRQRQLKLRQQIQKDRSSRKYISRIKQPQVYYNNIQSQINRQRQIIQRQMELQRIKQMESIKQTKINDIQKQLEKTRLEMRNRRSRLQLEDKYKRQQMTASGKTRSYYV